MIFLRAFAVAAGLLLSATAASADGSRRATFPDYASPAVNWSGVYVGVHGGVLKPEIETVDAAIFGGPFPTIAPDSAALGLHIGLQRQFGNFVLGVEGGVTAPVGDHRNTKDFVSLPGDDTVYRAGIEKIWFVGPRLGYAIGHWMPYVTGGYASTTVKAENVQFGVPEVFWDERMHGWYLGSGIDWAISRNWTLALDYRHYDFGDKVIIPTVDGRPARFDAAKLGVTADAVTLRLSYKFGHDVHAEPLK